MDGNLSSTGRNGALVYRSRCCLHALECEFCAVHGVSIGLLSCWVGLVGEGLDSRVGGLGLLSCISKWWWGQVILDHKS